MAHWQMHGKRISGKKLSLLLSKTVDLELWGPTNIWASPREEYEVSSSDTGRVALEPGPLDSTRNVRLYKATGNAFGIAKVMVHAGNLPGDFVEIHVLPNPSTVPFASWYEEVVPGIMRALRAGATRGGPKLVNKAGFFLAQAFSEQSPGAVGDPSANGNRLFNVQALVTRNSANHITGIVPGQTDAGVTIQNLNQGEGGTVATRVMRVSPTFVYDSTERAVTHYIKVLQERYRGAFSVITTPSATFAQFAQALQDAKFATHERYAADLQSNSGLAIRGARTWVSFELQVVADELARTTKTTNYDRSKVDALKEELELLRDAKEQFERFR